MKVQTVIDIDVCKMLLIVIEPHLNKANEDEHDDPSSNWRWLINSLAPTISLKSQTSTVQLILMISGYGICGTAPRRLSVSIDLIEETSELDQVMHRQGP